MSERRRRLGTALSRPALMRPQGRWASIMRSVTDRVIAISSELTGEDLDGKLAESMPVPDNETGVDPFGADLDTVRLSGGILVHLHRFWFRTEVHGIDNIPDGRVLLVSNHAGQIPLDGVVIACAMMLDKKEPRFVRSMLERFISTMPFISVWFPRMGQVLGTPDNARRLLENDEVLLVFPEGVKGISKTFDERYKLAPFGPGFLRLALETNSPIVPVAVIGSEEQYPSVARLQGLAKALGLPALPIIPQLFAGMWMPLPTKYRLYFGDPIHVTGDPDDEDAVIDEKVWRVQATIQSMLNRGLKERKAIFW